MHHVQTSFFRSTKMPQAKLFTKGLVKKYIAGGGGGGGGEGRISKCGA